MNSLTIPAGEALKGQASDADFSIARRYRSIDLEVFYFNDRNTPSNNCDRTGPSLGGGPLGGAYHQLTGTTLRWQVPASDASGVWRVLAVFNPNTVTAGQGTWTPLELLKDPTGVSCPTGSFCGQSTVSGTTRLTYVLQAVDNRGNVTWLDYVPVQLPASGVNPGLPLPVDVEVAPPCTPPSAPAITAPPYANAGKTGLAASVPSHAGSTYAWSVSANGQITSGQGTSAILFSALSAGPLTLSVTESTAPGCTSPPGTATVTVLPEGTTPPMRLFALAPCRLVDTRMAIPDGLHEPILQPSPATRTFAIPAGLCGIPADALALSVNYSVVGNPAAGDLKAWAADEPSTPGSTVLSFPATRTRANNGFLKLSLDGSRAFTVELLSTQPAHFVLDVNGVFR
jgi:hypothetical protein